MSKSCKASYIAPIFTPIDLDEIDTPGRYIIPRQSGISVRSLYYNPLQRLRYAMKYAYESLEDSYKHSNGISIILRLRRC